MRPRLALLPALAAVALSAPAPAAAAPATPAEIVAKLNAVRVEHGLPGGVTLNADWTQSCRQHNDYMAANDTLTHDQVPGRPGYTGGGAWAGQNAVLSQGSTWTRGTVFMNAPIHLAQILSPRLTSIGAAESDEYVCMTSWPGYAEESPAPADRLYSFPGDGQRFPHLQVAAERPFTPQSRVGIPEGATTGPYLYVWWEGPSNEEEYDPDTGQLVRGAQPPLEVISTAVLVGPDGPVEVKVVDRDEVNGYIAKSSGWVLPVRPLQPGALYTARVTFATKPGAEVARSWTGSFSFTATAARLTSYIPAPGIDAGGVPAKISRGRLLRRGLSARVRLDGPGVVRAQLFAGRRLLAVSPTHRMKGAGDEALRLRPIRGLLRPDTRRLVVKLAVAGDDDVAPYVVTRRVSVRR